jgi:hypothetical protein
LEAFFLNGKWVLLRVDIITEKGFYEIISFKAFYLFAKENTEVLHTLGRVDKQILQGMV